MMTEETEVKDEEIGDVKEDGIEDQDIPEVREQDTKGPTFFCANETVLIFHGPLIYEGKILSIPKSEPASEETDGPVESTYLVHYFGWNKKWDEVVPESRVLKFTEENVRRQKDHKISYEASLRSGGGKKQDGKTGGGGGCGRPSFSVTTSTSKNAPSVTGESVSGASTGDSAPESNTGTSDDALKGSKPNSFSALAAVQPPEAVMKQKKKLETHIESELRFVTKQVVEIAIPDRLKMVLVDDFDKVNRQKKLLKLPGRHPIVNLLEVYKNHLKVNPKTPASQFLFVDGVKDFFNMLIGSQLLYPFERQQYGEFLTQVEESEERAKNDDKLEPLAMSNFYGPVHLIRLFTKLGTSLAFTTMEEVPLLIFKNYAQDLLLYMVRNESDLFQPKRDYTMSLPDYQRNGPL